MSRNKFQKGMLMASSALVILWFAVIILTEIFRTLLLGTRFKSAGRLFLNTYLVPEAAIFLGAMCILTANYLVYGNSENRKLPLLLSSAAAAVVPAVVRLSYVFQYDVLDTYEGGDRAVGYAFYNYSFYHRYMLSVYQQTVMPFSYIFYAGAAASVISAAVYAFGGTRNTVKAVRASQIILALGAAAQTLLYLFQKNILGRFYETEQTERIVFFPAIAACLAAFGIIYAVQTVIDNKGKLAPLIGSVSALLLLPFLTVLLSDFQAMSIGTSMNITYTHMPTEYCDGLRFYNSISISLFYFIYAGIVIAAAASAVNLFSEEDF